MLSERQKFILSPLLILLFCPAVGLTGQLVLRDTAFWRIGLLCGVMGTAYAFLLFPRRLVSRLAAAFFWVLPLLASLIAIVVGKTTTVPFILLGGLAAFLLFGLIRSYGWLRRLTFLPLWVAGAWLLLEVSLGVLYPNWDYATGEISLTLRQWNLREHTDLLGNHRNMQTIRFRDFEYMTAKPAGVKRIVCLGSSTTFGCGLDKDQTYPYHLRQMLGAGYEVINAGVGQYNSEQLGIYLRDVLLPLKPDMVIMYYALDWETQIDAISWYWNWSQAIFGRTASMQEKPFAETRLRLFSLTYDKKFYFYTWSRVYGMWRTLEGHPPPVFSRNIDKTLRDMIEQSEKAGALFLLIPEMDNTGKIASEGYAELMREEAKKNDWVFFIDLTGKISDPSLFMDEVHFTPEGNRLFASILLPTVQKMLEKDSASQ